MPQKKSTNNNTKTTAEVAQKAVKKVAKKVVAKKVVTKKAVKKTVKKIVTKASCTCKKKCAPAQAFWINNGPVVKSIEDLVKAMKEMSDMQFSYHTKRDGNDFAKWIQDCLGDTACATSLKKAQTRVGAIRILSSRCSCC